MSSLTGMRQVLVSAAAMLTLLTAACAPAAAPASPTAKPAAAAPTAAKPAASPGASPAAQPAAPAAAAPAASSLPPDYFAGKTITGIVEFTAGGPSDAFGRLVGRFLTKHLPGSPTVIIENRVGAGGIIGRNQFAATGRKDGTTIGLFTGPATGQIMGAEGLQYDATQFVWLAGVNESAFIYARTDTGVQDLTKLTRPDKEIVIGGLSPDNLQDLYQQSFLETVGASYKHLTGFPGGSEIYAAAVRGETSMGYATRTAILTALAPHIQGGILQPLVHTGVIRNGTWVRDQHVSGVPMEEEAVLQLKGDAVKSTIEYRGMMLVKSLAGTLVRGIVLPPGSDPAAAAILTKAMRDIAADPEFQTASAAQMGGVPVDFLIGDEAHALAVSAIRNGEASTEALAYIKQLSNKAR